ncbi:hypothetical protein ACRAWD_10080 [Caulobacter segnis]
MPTPPARDVPACALALIQRFEGLHDGDRRTAVLGAPGRSRRHLHRRLGSRPVRRRTGREGPRDRLPPVAGAVAGRDDPGRRRRPAEGRRARRLRQGRGAVPRRR